MELCKLPQGDINTNGMLIFNYETYFYSTLQWFTGNMAHYAANYTSKYQGKWFLLAIKCDWVLLLMHYAIHRISGRTCGLTSNPKDMQSFGIGAIGE